MDPVQDDYELATWLDSGWYSYVDPLGQFDFDDDLEKAFFKDPWPWQQILAKWRPLTFDLWRRLKRMR